jgi:DNA-binding HxlR family transcriptional regulator
MPFSEVNRAHAARAEIPPAVTYGVTERMQEIKGALEMLDALAHKWQDEDTKRVRQPKLSAKVS